MNALARSLTTILSLFGLTIIALTACTAVNTGELVPPIPGRSPAENAAANACQVSEPLWIKPPEDSAVQGTPDYGHYFVNEDRSIWASAWWTDQEENYLLAGEEGIKVGWFRPEGAELEIAGQRIDTMAPPLEAHVPCCYPTRFQATGLIFPTEGCWKVTAKAADNELSFVIWVEPQM